jgi:hypothetical protein
MLLLCTVCPVVGRWEKTEAAHMDGNAGWVGKTGGRWIGRLNVENSKEDCQMWWEFFSPETLIQSFVRFALFPVCFVW